MDFCGAPPPHYSRLLMGDIGWSIFGEGEIDGQSSERLSNFLKENEVPMHSSVTLHSDGGSLEGGMALGRVIREHQLHTYIGQKGEWDSFGYWKTLPGQCMSAAAIAFLGGDFRYVGHTNKFGVHRFTLGADEIDKEGRAQVQSASVIEYIRLMDVNTELFTLASETPPNEIFVIPEETLVRLNVANNGRKTPKPIWTIESREGIVYLRGEQETWNGLNKFLILFPPNEDVGLYVIFDAGVNADDVMRMEADRLAIDGQYFRMRECRSERTNINSRINAIYRLTNEHVQHLLTAKHVGMIFQFFEEGASFQGFNMMPFDEAAEKLPGLIAMHRRGRAPEGK